MRESIGNSFIFYFVIIFFALFILFFVGALSYTKAFKVKNRIVDIIENNDGLINNAVESEIDKNLGEMGYRIDPRANCKNQRFENDSSYKKVEKTTGSSYRYCIYEKTIKDKGKYYAVVAYMYFEVPLIGANLEFPVFGETKVFTKIKY